MRTYEVIVNHYYDDNQPVKHTHRVQMPHRVWLDLSQSMVLRSGHFMHRVEKGYKIN